MRSGVTRGARDSSGAPGWRNSPRSNKVHHDFTVSCGSFRIARVGLKPRALSPREKRALVNEAELVAKWVGTIKTAFTPRLCFNRSENGAVRLFAHAGVVGLKIVYCEVQVVRIGRGVPGVTVGARIKAREDGSTTIKVMPPGGDPHSRLVYDSRIIRGCLLDAGDGNDYAEQFGRRHMCRV